MDMIEKHYKRQLIVLKEARGTNNNDNNNNTNKKQTATFRWVPKIGPKMKKEIKFWI